MQVAAVTIGTTAVDAADRLGQLKMAEDASIDFYSFVRSSYYQMRRAELRESIGLGAAVDSPALDDPEATTATTAPTVTPATAPRQAKKLAAGRGSAGRGALAQ
jgi:hypothetical protein